MKLNLKQITAIATAVIGLIVIILGCTLLGDAPRHNANNDSISYKPSSYSVEGASFGADFYTYMYKSSDTIVDELSDINGAIGTVVKAQAAANENLVANVKATDDLIQTVGKAGGIVTISIGLAILAYAVQCAGVAFAPERKVAPEVQ